MTHHFRSRSLQVARKPLSAAGFPEDWPTTTRCYCQTWRGALRVVHVVKVVVVAEEDERDSPGGRVR